MKSRLSAMLDLQDAMNSKVNADWRQQGFPWYRAIWVECAELLDHYGWKWWKHQQPDMEQVKLELIDIWHFGLSALFRDGKTIEQIASEIDTELAVHEPTDLGVREATEELALHCLQTRGFSPSRFWDLMLASGLDFDGLYAAYVGKNVLNFFRQDHGYKEGTYVKNWAGREDNEHLVELVELLDKSAENFSDQVYQMLEKRYRELVPQA